MGQKLWLIRTGGRIVGPYTFEEVSTRLVSREVTLLDEAALPNRFFKTMREIPEFFSVVQEFDDDDSSDTSLESGTAALDMTQTYSVTADLSHAELTHKVSMQEAVSDEIIYDDIKEIKTPLKSEVKSVGVERFSATGDAAISRQAQTQTSGVRSTIFIIIGLLLGAVAVHHFYLGPKSSKVRSLSQLEMANQYFQNGQYLLAFDKMSSIFQVNPQTTAIYLPLALLNLQIEKNSRVALDLLDRLNEKPDSELSQGIRTAQGLAYIYGKDFVAADSILSEVLVSSPNHLPALVNQGVKSNLIQQFGLSVETLRKASVWATNDPVVQLIFAKSLTDAGLFEGKPEYFAEAEQILSQIISLDQAYMQEAMLLNLFISTHLGRGGYDEALVELLDQNPSITSNYKYDPFMYVDFVDWPQLYAYCERTIGALADTYYTKALEALCLIKSGQGARAKRVVEDAVARAPSNPLVMALYSFILNEQSLRVEASVALGTAVRNNRFEKHLLPHLIQAQFCTEAGDWECAEQEWSEVLEKKDRELGALTGMATVKLKLQKLQEAQLYITKAQQVTDQFTPIRVLSSKVPEQ